MRTEIGLSRRLLTIAMAVFIGMTACHRRSEDYVPLVDATTTGESHKEDDRMLEEQRRQTNELEALEKRQAVLKQQLEEQGEVVAQSERRIHDLRHSLQQEKAETDSYINQHQLQVACAYARQVAAGEGEYSEKTRSCARKASVLCAVVMVNPAFRRKVAIAKQHVDKAEDSAQLLKKQIVSEQQKAKAEKATLQALLQSIDRVAGDISALRQHQPLPDRLQSVPAPLTTSDF